MMDAMLFRQKHQLWLRLAFLSFAVDDPTIKNRLYEFSQIEFRHLKWLSQELTDCSFAYDYGREKSFGIEFATLAEGIGATLAEIGSVQTRYDASALCERMLRDEAYFVSVLETFALDNVSLSHAFNRHRRWNEASLNQEQSDAFTLFLFEESYKEYELILIYLYRLVRSITAIQSSSFADLIDESHFHLRSFGEMMSKMGILSLPRELHPMTYQISDMEKFLENGIVEEENAKEECRRLSGAITDPTLSSFFEFVNFQESYHIEIMKKLLKENQWKI